MGCFGEEATQAGVKEEPRQAEANEGFTRLFFLHETSPWYFFSSCAKQRASFRGILARSS